MIESLLQDLSYALRIARRSPGFTLLAVVTLGLGIGANSAIFSVVDGVLLSPLPYAEPDRLLRIAHLQPEQGVAPRDFSPQDFADLESLAGPGASFSQLAAYSYFPKLAGMNLVGEGEPARLEAARVSPGFFRTLGVDAALGRALAPAEGVSGRDRVVVLSHRLWRQRFGGVPGIAGRKVSLDGEPFTVVGVMPAAFQFPAREVDVWVPISLVGEDDIPHLRSLRWMEVVGRLAPGKSRAEARAATDALFKRLAAAYPESNRDFGTAALLPLADALLGGVRPPLLLLLAAVALVLLIACANLAGLLLARAATRGRELAVRAALGAGRGRIVRQLLTESVLLALLGGILGTGLAVWGVDALRALVGGDLPRPDAIRLDARVLAFTFAVSLAAGLLFGLLPALRASRPEVQRTLREGGRGGAGRAGRQGARAALVVAETALAVVLLAGAGLLLRSFWRLIHVDPGFRSAGVLTLSLSLDDVRYPDSPSRDRFRGELLRRVGALPGVIAVGGAKTMPLAGAGEPYSFTVDGREVTPAGGALIVTPGYFEALGVPVLRGRTFTAHDSAERPALVVNRALAEQLWPGLDPVGRTVTFGPADGAINFAVLGVVGDVRNESLTTAPAPALYVPSAIFSRSSMKLFVRTATTAPLLLARPVRQAIWSIDAAQPVSDVAPLVQVVAGTVSRPRLVTALLTLFAALAAVLAGLGTYGIVSQTVAERTHEIGIRMALGARRAAVVRLIVGQGVALTAAGLGLGLAAALGTARLLGSLLYGVGPADPGAFAATALLLALVALLASWLPARRAAGVDPMEAIRYE